MELPRICILSTLLLCHCAGLLCISPLKIYQCHYQGPMETNSLLSPTRVSYIYLILQAPSLKGIGVMVCCCYKRSFTISCVLLVIRKSWQFIWFYLMTMRHQVSSRYQNTWITSFRQCFSEARRRKWLQTYPESTSNDEPIVFDTSIIPWWAWIKRFHLPEAELLNGLFLYLMHSQCLVVTAEELI